MYGWRHLLTALAEDKDELEVGQSTDLTALKSVTILDTGLHITPEACNNAKLAAAFSALQEIRGVLKVNGRARASLGPTLFQTRTRCLCSAKEALCSQSDWEACWAIHPCARAT